MPGYLQHIGRIAAVTLADTNLMVPVPFLVRRRFRETADTVTLEMVPQQSQDRIDFSPGQFNMLYAFGIGEVPISISGDPARPETLMHTIRAVGAVSSALVRMKQGAMVGVRGAFGKGWPVHEACGKDVVLIGGGIGLAPLRPVIHHLLNNRKAFEGVTLLCGARTPRDIIFRRHLKRWQRRTDFQVEVTVDAAGADVAGTRGSGDAHDCALEQSSVQHDRHGLRTRGDDAFCGMGAPAMGVGTGQDFSFP